MRCKSSRTGYSHYLATFETQDSTSWMNYIVIRLVLGSSGLLTPGRMPILLADQFMALQIVSGD